MTWIAFCAERMRELNGGAWAAGRELLPLLRLLLDGLGRAVDVFWGLVEAYWDHPVAGRARDRLDQRVAGQHRSHAPDVVAPRAQTAGLQGFGHGHLRRGMLATFDSGVKRAARHSRVLPDWQLADRHIVELRPEEAISEPRLR